jgi:AcrR family transcriptional regulator
VRSIYGRPVARARKQLDYGALAEALTADLPAAPDMAAVARRLCLAKPTLYRLAGSREGLIGLSVDAEGERLLEAIHRHGVAGVFEFAEATPAGMKLLFTSGFPAALGARRRVERRLSESLRRELAERGEEQPERLQSVAAGVLGMAAGIAAHATSSRDSHEAEHMRSDFDRAAKVASVISDREAVLHGTRRT